MQIKSIQKRDGRVVKFELQKITNAIYQAGADIGRLDEKLAENLAKKVSALITKKIKPKIIPTIEIVQDLVEETLSENHQEEITEAYSSYRRHRAEIRKQKERVLNKKEIDEIDKKFDINAVKVLAARYLRKNEKGEITESIKEAFERVAVQTVLPSLLYDHKIFRKNGKFSGKEPAKNPILTKEYAGKIKIGPYALNPYHVEALGRIFRRFKKNGQLKISERGFLNLFKTGYFDKYEKEIAENFGLMTSRRFIPNTPALINFGNPLGLGSACFVLDIEDSMESIMSTLKNAALIFQAGGGVGYNFSKLRPEGDYVKSTHGVASGPISFMKLYDAMTETIKQGGVRRGANMGILNSNHPDIEKFISIKEGNTTLRNFNISVLIMSDFWEYLKKGKPYPLINPHNQKIAKEIDPKKLFDKIVYSAWHSAEPGVIFEDRANEHNPLLKFLGPIHSTNPCGELLLYPYESCNLGSLNLWNFIEEKENKKEINWNYLEETIHQAVCFLDNVVDVNLYPLEKIEEMTLATRKIGLGIMGLGDLLYDLEIPYNSKEGLKKIEEIIEFVNYHSKVASIKLAKERGAFPYFKNSSYIDGELPFSGIEDKKSWHFDWKKISRDIAKNGLRNTYTTAIAPTGSISMIAGCSSGMEPVYSLIFEKNVAVGNFYYLDPVFEEKFRKEGLMKADILNEINAHGGSLAKVDGIPERLKKIFVTAHDISPEDHVRALSAVQKWVDSSVSKTNNFPADATVKDVEEVYLLAHNLGCKDVTVFRDTSIKDQVLVGGKIAKTEEKIAATKDEKAEGLVVYPEESAKTKAVSALEILPLEKIKEPEAGAPKKCPSCGGQLIKQEGCIKCPVCGWGACL